MARVVRLSLVDSLRRKRLPNLALLRKSWHCLLEVVRDLGQNWRVRWSLQLLGWRQDNLLMLLMGVLLVELAQHAVDGLTCHL